MTAREIIVQLAIWPLGLLVVLIVIGLVGNPFDRGSDH